MTSDVGIELRGTGARVGDRRPLLDFGRPDDPDHKLLRCNGTERGARIPGYDVHIAVGSDGSGSLLLAGNTWDHVRRGSPAAPPTTAPSRPPPARLPPSTRAARSSRPTSAASIPARRDGRLHVEHGVR
ncbi:MAG: hypothetical protein E6J90_10820 [Deltaproteobacteria bacterium]|nr:MAG: hypothetical protein E6J91_42855 [Deltaproteobacteria bacterium]TMQ23315.1 MAG: hypothetical protein E6J90_10820 [Deltaproteobacteria bacterium]